MTRVARPSSLPPASDKLVVVEASAGTGKTYFLEHRVVDLILAGAELGQILVVTFTDKAVAELRMRIRDLLDRLSRAEGDEDLPAPYWEITDDSRRALRRAVMAFDHAPIYTIHGFCHRVLVDDAFAARRLFEQDQVADEVAFDAAFSTLLRERFARESPDRELLSAFLESGRSVDQLRELLLRCARSHAVPRRHFEPEIIQRVAADLYASLGNPAQRGAIANSVRDRRFVDDWLDEIGYALGRATPESEPGRLLGVIDEVRERARMVLGKIDRLPAFAEATKALRSVELTISTDEAIAAQMVPYIVERVTADKAERGLFDYDDMLSLVAEALRGPRGGDLAARLRSRTPWVMIDEFQDTDPTQWHIFRMAWMHEDTRSLTIVGDPKQAIYGFRGADVETYLAARDDLLRAGATRVQLDINRRSTAPLVEAVNQILIGNPLMPLLDKSITYDAPVKASGDVVCDAPGPPVRVFAVHAPLRRDIEAVRAALASAIASAIEELRDNPPSWQHRGVDRPFALGDVMVLTRTNKDTNEIASTLRARGLPCALVEGDRLFKTREASELASVLAAIAAPRDRSARLRALRTRFFDVPWSELMRVVDAPDHHPLIARLFAWSSLAARRGYETLFRELVEDSRYAERALVLGGGERALINTWHVIELLLTEVSRARCDLSELVVQLRRWIADEWRVDDSDVQRAETDADAIRILTIHKAKGLEAPFVFIYGGSGPPPKVNVHTLREATGRALVVGTPEESIQRRLDSDADAENQRLAYVALTRAQVRMYLPVYGDGVLADKAAYGPIQRCVAPLIDHRRGSPRFGRIEVPVGAPPEPTPPEVALAGFETPSPPELITLAELAPSRRGLAMLSYTRLAHDLEVTVNTEATGADEIEPAEFDVDDSTGLVGPDDLPPGADSGLLLHDVLEVADLELARQSADPDLWLANAVVAEQLATAARERGVDPRFIPHAARIIHRTLTQPLGDLGSMVGATALAREVEFCYPLPRRSVTTETRSDVVSSTDDNGSPTLFSPPIGGDPTGLVRGYIDALIAWNDELWVLDYKSDLLAGDNLVAAAERRVREHYAVQMRLYAIAADRMRGSRRLAGLLFGFIRHDVVVPIRVDSDMLTSWTSWLGSLAVAT